MSRLIRPSLPEFLASDHSLTLHKPKWNTVFRSSQIREVEELLNNPKFRGVPMGHTLGITLHLAVCFGASDKWTASAALLDRVRVWRHSVFPKHRQDHWVDKYQGHYLITWMDDIVRINDLIQPVYDSLGPAKCVVLCGTPRVRERLRGNKTILWYDEMSFDVRAWRSDFNAWWPEWKRCLKTAVGRYSLPRYAFWPLALYGLVQTQQVAACYELMERLKPAVILTEHDRNPNWSCLILTAKALGIPTLTLVHGVTEKGPNVPFVPVLADKVLCWGKLDYTNLTEAGVNPARLAMVGCPRLDRELRTAPAVARAKAGLEPGKPVVLLASNPIEREARRSLAEQFCLGLRDVKECIGVVRLHPVERLDDYAGLIERFPDVRFLENRVWTLDEALAASSVVVVCNSGFGSDALVKGRPIIAFEGAPGVQLGHIEDVVQATGCPRVHNAAELAEAVRLLLRDGPEQSALCERAERFVQDFCVSFGREAANRIARHVEESAKVPRVALEACTDVRGGGR